jgi:hypothetical protein
MKYDQLAQFSIIVLEVVVTPSALGGAAYWFLRDHSQQMLFTAIAAGAGLVIAFYRISLLNKKWSKNGNE